MPLALNAQPVPPGTPPSTTPQSPWKPTASVAVKETFDSNVYMQDLHPTAANAALARANGLTPVEAVAFALLQ